MATEVSDLTGWLLGFRVSDLARLSLKDPEFVSVHAEAVMSTPPKLRQGFIVCELQQKIDLLWFFIKTHLKKKTVIFVSTCKQVRTLTRVHVWLRQALSTSISACTAHLVATTFAQASCNLVQSTSACRESL